MQRSMSSANARGGSMLKEHLARYPNPDPQGIQERVSWGKWQWTRRGEAVEKHSGKKEYQVHRPGRERTWQEKEMKRNSLLIQLVWNNEVKRGKPGPGYERLYKPSEGVWLYCKNTGKALKLLRGRREYSWTVASCHLTTGWGDDSLCHQTTSSHG